MRWLHVVGLGCLVVLVACKSSPNTEEAFTAAADEVARLEDKFASDYERAETELQKLRERDPAAAAKLIDTAILPLFPPITAAITKAHELGTQLADSDIKDDGKRAQAKKILEKFVTNRRGFERIRDAYAEQSKKLAKGPLTEADIDAFTKSLEDGQKLLTD